MTSNFQLPKLNTKKICITNSRRQSSSSLVTPEACFLGSAPWTTTSAHPDLEEYSAGFQKCIRALVGSLGSNRISVQITAHTPLQCSPNHTEDLQTFNQDTDVLWVISRLRSLLLYDIRSHHSLLHGSVGLEVCGVKYD